MTSSSRRSLTTKPPTPTKWLAFLGNVHGVDGSQRVIMTWLDSLGALGSAWWNSKRSSAATGTNAAKCSGILSHTPRVPPASKLCSVCSRRRLNSVGLMARSHCAASMVAPPK
eukprot:Amastigsp_a679211_36.p7 type:complete len:113 gc:universal Amastigsp_a679211_36:1013-1351(+)